FTTAPGSLNPPLNQNKIRLRQAGNWAADYLFMRVAEQYLIEAEAAAKTNAEGEAIQILEALITTRDPNYSAAGLTGQALLDEIYLQRRIELWGEGRALLDMKRLQTGLNRPTGDGNHNGWDLINEENKALNFNVPATGATNAITIPDKDPRFLWRIPQNEIDANKNLTDADQNP
ncbi:MAG TPA: RagB/SusD family nutrient uptake outer membrane protein, partial [Sphingobacteriaceae bacterium]|nr:RagB/SusD family nutrient uptake outer membrane protein [Sphingobacteriaceae bacterium]